MPLQDKVEIADNIIAMLWAKRMVMWRVGAHKHGWGKVWRDGQEMVYVAFKASGKNYKKGLRIYVYYNSDSDEYIVEGIVTYNGQQKIVGTYTGVQVDQVHSFIEKITDGTLVKPVYIDPNATEKKIKATQEFLDLLHSEVTDEKFAVGGSLRPLRDYIPAYKLISKLPKQNIPPEAQNKIDQLLQYIVFLKSQPVTDITSQFMPVYFGQIINGIVYELYFPEVKKANREIIAHIGNLPALSEKVDENQKIVKAEFNRLDERTHPVRANLFFMDSIPVIRDIEKEEAKFAKNWKKQLSAGGNISAKKTLIIIHVDDEGHSHVFDRLLREIPEYAKGFNRVINVRNNNATKLWPELKSYEQQTWAWGYVLNDTLDDYILTKGNGLSKIEAWMRVLPKDSQYVLVGGELDRCVQDIYEIFKHLGLSVIIKKQFTFGAKDEPLLAPNGKKHENSPDTANERLEYLLGDKGSVAAIGEEIGLKVEDGIAVYKSKAGSYRYVLYENGRAISALQFMSHDRHSAILANGYTVPEKRGQGIGKKLYSQAKKYFSHIEFSNDRSKQGEWFVSSITSNPAYLKSGGSIVGMKFNRVSDDIYEVNSDNQILLAKTFVRFQTYVDSPKFRGTVFTLDEFKEHFSAGQELSSNGEKVFSYYLNYSGFNVPDYVFDEFYGGKFNPLSPDEEWLLGEVVLAKNNQSVREHITKLKSPYYIIGYVGTASKNSKHHEFAHAFYYLYAPYREEAEGIVNQLRQEMSEEVLQTLYAFMEKMKYHPDIWSDEIHAYLIASQDFMESRDVWFDAFAPYAEKLRQLYDKYYLLKIGNPIVTCDNCGWSWREDEGGSDVYTCHKCGHDNAPEKVAISGSNAARLQKIMTHLADVSKMATGGEINADGGLVYEEYDEVIAERAQIITLPKNIAGTNCGNCLFQKNNFCDHKKVVMPVTSRMCCAYWTDKSLVSIVSNVFDANFFPHKEKEQPVLNEHGGYDYSGHQLQRAEKADLITLPQSVVGTNCGNCKFISGGTFCNHPQIQLPVNNRMSCWWWDNSDVVRAWGKAFEMNNDKIGSYATGGDLENSEKPSNFDGNTAKNEIRNILSGVSEVTKGAAIQAASAYLRANARVNTQGAGRKSEWQKLEDYISANNLWFKGELGPYLAERVYRFDANYVVKLNPHTYYGAWLEYFDNLLLHNHFFPLTAYELIGFIRHKGELNAIVKQPFIDAIPSSISDIKNFMNDNGFFNTGHTYKSNIDYQNIGLGVLINDLHEKNVLTGKDGLLYFIDTNFRLDKKAKLGLNNLRLEDGGAVEDVYTKEKVKKAYVSIRVKYETGQNISETENIIKSIDKSVFEQLHNQKLQGITGISTSNYNLSEWLVFRECLVVMPFVKLRESNTLEQVKYYDADYLTANECEALFRLYDRRGRADGDYQQILQNLFPKIAMEFELEAQIRSNPQVANQFYSLKDIFDIYRSGKFIDYMRAQKRINSAEDMARITYEYISSGKAKEDYYYNIVPDTITVDDLLWPIKRGIVHSGGVYDAESEWLVKNNELSIPKGSQLFFVVTGYANMVEEYEKMVEKYELRKNYTVNYIPNKKLSELQMKRLEMQRARFDRELQAGKEKVDDKIKQAIGIVKAEIFKALDDQFRSRIKEQFAETKFRDENGESLGDDIFEIPVFKQAYSDVLFKASAMFDEQAQNIIKTKNKYFLSDFIRKLYDYLYELEHKSDFETGVQSQDYENIRLDEFLHGLTRIVNNFEIGFYSNKIKEKAGSDLFRYYDKKEVSLAKGGEIENEKLQNSDLENILNAQMEKCKSLECDGATRILDYVLNENNVPHYVFQGVVKLGDKQTGLHMWIGLPDGRLVDFKAQMWLGKDAPNGIFYPAETKAIYEGQVIEINSTELVYKILCPEV